MGLIYDQNDNEFKVTISELHHNHIRSEELFPLYRKNRILNETQVKEILTAVKNDGKVEKIAKATQLASGKIVTNRDVFNVKNKYSGKLLKKSRRKLCDVHVYGSG